MTSEPATPGSALARETRMPFRDRMHDGHRVIAQLGPLRLPTRQIFAEALHRLAVTGPDARLGLEPGRGGRTWRFDPARLRSRFNEMVVEGAWADGSEFHSIVHRTLGEDDPSRLVRFVLGRDHLVQITDHRLGDASFTTTLLRAVLDAADGSIDPTYLGSVARPFQRAVRRTFLADPWRSAALLRDRMSGRVNCVPSTTLNAPEPRVSRPWSTYVALDRATFRAVRIYAREAFRGVGFNLVQTLLVQRGFASAGIPVDPRANMITDLRRYLDSGDNLLGNFIAGHAVMAGTAEAIRRESIRFRREGELGLPLSSHALGLARTAVRIGRRPWAATPSVGPVRLTLSSVGSVRGLERLPWADGAPIARYWSANADPSGVTVFSAVVDASLQLTVVYDAAVIEERLVAAAMRAISSDPVGILAR